MWTYPNPRFKKGELVTLTSGEYSDYGTHCLCRVLEDCTYQELMGDYLKEHPEQGEEYKANIDQFVHYLINERRVMEEVQYREWRVGEAATFRRYDLGEMDEEGLKVQPTYMYETLYEAKPQFSTGISDKSPNSKTQ